MVTLAFLAITRAKPRKTRSSGQALGSRSWLCMPTSSSFSWSRGRLVSHHSGVRLAVGLPGDNVDQ